MIDLKKLETRYLNAKIAYYEGDTIMNDIVFDSLEQRLKDLGSKIVEQVGSKRKDFNFPHPTPMKSLSKIQTYTNNDKDGEFIDWVYGNIEKYLKHVGYNHPIKHIQYSPKFDGSAINIVYRNNNIDAILTRGDGTLGKNVTNKFKQYVPNTIPINGIVEIRCEVVMNTNVFNTKYSNKFANPRNIVAGIIGKDEIDIGMISDLTIVPIHLLIHSKYHNINLFNVNVTNYPLFLSTNNYHNTEISGLSYKKIMSEWETKRQSFDYQLDGIVFSFLPEHREKMGETDHSPNWAIAIKFIPDEIVTTVERIEWNLGKTGEMIPVIIFKPIDLMGTIVKRASGYNAGYIVNNRIQPGTIVSVCKRGDIIPTIQEIIYSPE